jgi:hypothetical protein
MSTGRSAWHARGVAWDERLFELLDDLEGQAESLYAVERDAELADRSRAAYATVTLAGRLMASMGRELALDVSGVGRVEGSLRRMGTGWCLVRGAAARDWLVVLDAVVAVEGASGRSLPEVAWSPVSRLGLGSALRRLADEGVPCVVHLRTGGRHDLVPTRVGQDFVEGIDDGGERRVLLGFGALAAVASSEAREG